MIYLKLIYSLCIIFLAGRFIIAIKPFGVAARPVQIRVPLYFFAGTAVVSIYMFLLSLYGVKFGIAVISAPFLIYGLFLLPRLRLSVPDIKDLKFTPLVSVVFAILILISVSFGYLRVYH